MRTGWRGGISDSQEETIKFGQEFSKYIENGDVIALHGYLGTGKTTLVKGILEGLGYIKSVTSPTYTMINEYIASKNIIHIDCYKENDLSIWISLGLNDYINDKKNILKIEWPDILIDILPNNTITIKFEHISEITWQGVAADANN